MNKKENIQINDVLDNIIEHMDKPIFTYNEKYNYDEMWNRIKKRPFTKERILFFCKVFIITTIICFLISRSIHNIIIINHVLVILISFILSIILTIQILRHRLLRIEKKIDNKVFFYKSLLIIKTKEAVFKYSYNELSKIEETDSNFNLYFGKRTLIIEKNKIDNQAIDYLTNLKSNYENKQVNFEEDNIWNSIDKYIENAVFSCNNIINEDTINQFCNLKKEKMHLFLFVFFSNLIICGLAILKIAHSFSFSYTFGYIIYCSLYIVVLIFGLNLALMSSYISRKKTYLIKECKKKSYDYLKIFFYNDFMLIKSNNKIIEIKYTDIKNTLNNEKYIFIKFNFFKSPINNVPIILNKDELIENNINFFKKYIK